MVGLLQLSDEVIGHVCECSFCTLPEAIHRGDRPDSHGSEVHFHGNEVDFHGSEGPLPLRKQMAQWLCQVPRASMLPSMEVITSTDDVVRDDFSTEYIYLSSNMEFRSRHKSVKKHHSVLLLIFFFELLSASQRCLSSSSSSPWCLPREEARARFNCHVSPSLS